jgi:hypothetical protein
MSAMPIGSAVSILLLLVQIILIILTWWYIPMRIQLRAVGLLLVAVITPAIWFAYSVLALFVDTWLGNDGPAVVYLLLGFFSTLVGCAVFTCRWVIKKFVSEKN